MKAFIEEFIDKFGGRKSGSDEEDCAQDYLRQKLEPFCASTYKHIFHYPLFARFITLKWFGILHFVNLGLYFVSPALALVLAIVNAIVFYGQFVANKGWLNGLFANQSSSNVAGTLEPQGEVQSTIIISGHMDSTKEFIWWYWLGQLGVILTITGSIMILTLPLFLLVLWLGAGIGGSIPEWAIWIWGALTLLSLSVFTLIFLHGKRVVPGAQDNLSGIAVAYEMMQRLADTDGKSQLAHTRLRMLSFGSEEAGVVGSSLYAKEHKETLKAENAHLINLDGIMHLNELKIIRKEFQGGVTFDHHLGHKLAQAFQNCRVNYTQESLSIGGTDGASFARHNIPAVTVLGLNVKQHDPTYHTRIDVPEYVEEEAMEAMTSVLTELIHDWDKASD